MCPRLRAAECLMSRGRSVSQQVNAGEPVLNPATARLVSAGQYCMRIVRGGIPVPPPARRSRDCALPGFSGDRTGCGGGYLGGAHMSRRRPEVVFGRSRGEVCRSEKLSSARSTIGPRHRSALFWHPTAAAIQKAQQAPVGSVPVGFVKGQHLRRGVSPGAAGLDTRGRSSLPARSPVSAMSRR